MTLTAAQPLLELRDLRIESAHRGEPVRTLLEGLSFNIARGEFLALVGESGSGKTLAARAILDLLPPGVRRTSGAIFLAGRDLTRLSPRALRQVRGAQVGMVFQEPMVSLNPALTVGRQLAEGLKLHFGWSRSEIREHCLQMLARVRIKDPAHALRCHPHEFSGGMRQRIMLASVLLLRPKLLIADEPTTALDTLSQREVLDLIVELARDHGVATLLITHDLGLVARYAERCVVLEKGRLIETGATGEVLTRPAHAYTRRLIGSRPGRAHGARRSSGAAPVLLSVEGACAAYSRAARMFGAMAHRPVLHEIELSLRCGEIVAVVGASGCGKTTLGRAVLGLKTLSAGAIRFDGMTVGAMTAEQLRRFRRDAQLIFQDPFSSLDPRMTIADIVAAPLRHDGALGVRARRGRVEQVLEEVGLGGFGDRLAHQMSGGQRQRIAIARALVSRPRLVVADEPVSALDMTIQAQVLALLQELQSDYGFACLFITHDLSVVDSIADQMVVMSEGRIVERGPTRTVLEQAAHPYTRALVEATPRLPGERQLSTASPA
ncbi:MAG TPA: ABC transporter ATP-binding protein [Steroidobacteraceae bacterium]|nr:ABC transporter ATP-binding protein [Steroidobacteraceae bacterium]